MHSDKYKQVVKALVMKAYARVGKNKEEALGQAKILIEDIVDRGIDLNKLQEAFQRHAETSEFVPTLVHIMKHIETIPPQEEREFLVRFRKQATNPYPWDVEDDDVYTVKRLIGKGYLESGHLQAREWPFIEKQAIELYRQLRNKKLQLMESPYKDQVKTLPSGNGRYIEKSVTQSLKPSMAKLGESIASFKVIGDKKMLKVGNE